ncbi:MAG: hypothetical protein FWH02_02175 [Oscillospiraceae bacterium]|nr:hypothetical protein [Oscillospiraceae bacterium]
MAKQRKPRKQRKEPLKIEQYAKRLSFRLQKLNGYTRCAQCGAPAESSAVNFCPVCGGGDFVEGRDSDMIYRKIRLDESGKAVICPYCSNEEQTPGEYCMICGSEIINRCTDLYDELSGETVKENCGEVLPGNARYCYKCGNPGTFYRRGWLKDWRSENTRKAIENINIAVDYDDLKSMRNA